MYIAEIAPQERRGSLGAINQVYALAVLLFQLVY